MKKILIFILLINSIIFAEGIKLSPTTITSTTGFNAPLVEENKNITLITKEDISKKQYDNVENILRDTPNIVITNTQFGPTINLRGSGERSMSRVKVLVDGISLTPLEEAMGTLPINSIPVSSIEKIEVIPGGGATLYGSGTTGGVINIITIADTRKDFFNLNTKSGSYSNRDIDISLGQNLTDKLYLSLTSQYTNKNGYRDNEKLESKSFNGTLDYIINDRNRIKFQGLYFTDDGKTSTEVKKSILAMDRRAKGENIDFDSERESFSIDYEFKANDNWTLYANLFQTEYERNFLQDDTRDFEIPKIGKMPFSPTLENLKSTLDGGFIEKSKGIKLKSKYEYENGTLIGGYDYITTNVKRDSLVTTERFKFANAKFSTPISLPPSNILFENLEGQVITKNKLDTDKDTHALYLLNNYNVTEKLTLTTGIRYEHSKYNGYRSSDVTLNGYNLQKSGTMGSSIFPDDSSIRELSKDYTNIEKSNSNWAGEIGLNYRFSDVGSVYTRYERGFISPLPSQLTNKIKPDKTLDDKVPSEENNSTKEYSDSNLKSETIDSIEFGLKNMVGNSFITTSIFLSQTDDEITTLDKNANNPALKEWRFENIGQTKRIGAEIFIQQYLDRLTLTESITYIDAEITKVNSNEWLKKGDKVPMVSDWKISLGADYALTEKFSLGGTYVYNSGYEKRELESYDKIKTSGFGVTDIYGNYKIKDYLSVKIGVNNIFNEQYNYFETATTAIPAPERNYYVGFSLNF
jgi:iron complex outermembrane receptor protein